METENTEIHEQILKKLFSIPIIKVEKPLYGDGQCLLFETRDLYYISKDKNEIRFISKGVLDLWCDDGSLRYKTDKIFWGFLGNIRENPYENEYITANKKENKIKL